MLTVTNFKVAMVSICQPSNVWVNRNDLNFSGKSVRSKTLSISPGREFSKPRANQGPLLAVAKTATHVTKGEGLEAPIHGGRKERTGGGIVNLS